VRLGEDDICGLTDIAFDNTTLKMLLSNE
jgi:hypothetical protein